MALQTLVKVSNVTNLSDARYCAGMGVDLLGFSMDQDHPYHVEPGRFAEIRNWVAGVQIVGETASTDPETIEQLLTTYQPDWLQVTELAMLPYLRSFGKPLLLRVDLSGTSLEQLHTLAGTSLPDLDYLLLESPAMLHLDEDLKQAIGALAYRHAVLLGTGLQANTVQTLLAELPLAGIALTGGSEDRPGSRDFGELMDIMEVLEVD